MSSTTQRSYVTRMNVTCKSSNLIYSITCKRCKKQYVGQTKRRLMDGFQGHFYNVTRNVFESSVGRHFNEGDHKGIDDMEIHILDFIHQSPNSRGAAYLRDR